MERVLKPERFDTEPGKATSEQAWRHWKKTFDYFTDNCTGANQLDDTKKLTLTSDPESTRRANKRPADRDTGPSNGKPKSKGSRTDGHGGSGTS